MKTVHKQSQSANGSIPSASASRGGNHSGIVCYRCKQVGLMARSCENKPKLWCSFCRKSSHTDSTCRSKGKLSKNSKDEVHVVTATDDHQFAFKIDVGNHEKPGARLESLLVDCGATAHIVNDKRKFTRFYKSGFPLTWKTWKTPGKVLEFYGRPGIFGMISRFTRVLKL